MTEGLLELKKHIISAIRLIDNGDWTKTDIIIQFPPTINQGYVALPSFWDATNKRVRLFPRFETETIELLYRFIQAANKNGTINEIIFHADKEDLDSARIEAGYNSKVVADFEDNLSKSEKGKTIAWYKSGKNEP